MKYNGDKRDRKLSIAFDLNMHPGEQMSWVEKMPQLAVAVDERGIVEAVSRSLLEKLRMDKEQVIGNSLDRFLMLPQEISELNQPMEVHETPLYSIKGMLFPVGSSPMVADIQLLSGKTPRGWRHLLLTIPEEEHSNLLTRYADRIFHELTQGVILLRHSKVMEINPEACRMFRVKKDEVIGKVVDCLFVHPGEDEGLNDIRNRILRGEPFHGLSACWVDQNRSLAIHMDHKIIGKKPNDGTPSDTLLITTDVTQSYLLDMQVRQTDRLAMIGQIAAGTAHEIRNPLTSIRGFLQVMRHSSDEKKDLKGQGYTEIMLREIDRINNLVGEFLMMSKPRSLKRYPVKMDQVIQELLPIIENEALLHNIEVRYISPEKPCRPVWAGEELLKQVILNLCKNGIEAMDEGGILSIRLIFLPNDDFLTLEVQDNGPGISSQAMNKIFDPFYTTKENGTGLGLPVCKRIIQDLKGDIQVSSGETGAVFRIKLPCFSG